MNINLRNLARRAGLGMLLALTLACNVNAAPGEPGTIDATWGGGTGRVVTPIGGSGAGSPVVVSGVVQGNGRLIVASYCKGAEVNTNLGNPCLVRYLADGTLDASFGNGGIVHQSWFANKADYLREVFVQQDQKLLVIGDCSGICIARLNTDGSFDTTFGPSGTGIAVVLASNPAFVPIHATMHTTGAVTIAGFCTDGRVCAARVLPNGLLDGGFGTLGFARFDITAGDDVAAHAVAEPDGSVILAGSCNQRACLMRLDPSGALDTTFNGTGYRLSLCPAATDYASRVRRQPDGKYVVGATVPDNVNFMQTICVMRLNANGSIDNGFADAGSYLATYSVTGTNFGDLHVQPDGRIIVAGTCFGPYAVCARRLNGDGTEDSSFANVNGGTLYFTGSMSAASIPTRLTPTPSGNFYLLNACETGAINFPQVCSFRFEGGPQAYRACTLDFDGDGQVLSATDALLLMRMASGFKGTGLTSGISFPASASRTSAAAIERYAVDQCGFHL